MLGIQQVSLVPIPPSLQQLQACSRNLRVRPVGFGRPAEEVARILAEAEK